MIKNMSGAIGATHVSSDKLNLISSEHTMSDQLTIKASPHHRGVVTGHGAAYNAGARAGASHCMEITLLNILRQRLHIKLLQLQSCVAPFRICKDLKREKRKTHIQILYSI